MSRTLRLLLIPVAAVAFNATATRAELPEPKPYAVSWEFKFTYGVPTRILVEIAGEKLPVAYWYLPFSVTNDTDQERMFLPVVELVSRDGKITRSDNNVPPSVLDAIRRRQGNQNLQNTVQAAGDLRLGADQAKYAVAVWPENDNDMSAFSILVAGIAGEYQRVKDAQGKEVTLRKTLQLNFTQVGNNANGAESRVEEKPSTWIMR